MAIVSTREQLKDYCLRRLGWPVIEINVDLDQVEDRIDEAFEYYFDYHYDAVERKYLAHQVTQVDIDNGYITVPDSLIHVTNVIALGGGGAGGGVFGPMGDPSLAWNSTSANPLTGGTGGGGGYAARSIEDHAGGGSSTPMADFFLAMSQIELFSQIFGQTGSEPPIRFSRHTNRIYLDVEWVTLLAVGKWIVAEGWASLDPEVYADVYNDRWLKRYCTALIKRQWGANLIKYSGIALPGGVTLDGDKLFQQAIDEIEKLETEMIDNHSLPVDFFMG